MIIQLILVNVFVAVVYGNCGPCPEIPKHYEELGCKGIQHQGDCCPERFECPDFLSYNKTQCHLKGKSYEIGDELAPGIAPPCSAGCKCSGFSESATFNCAEIECPEFFQRPDEGCVLQHDLNKCCAVGKICDAEEVGALSKCALRGKEYRKGDWIYPEFAPCYQCLCNDEFDNSTSVSLNKNCRKIDCGIELRKLENIQIGCIPIYYGENKCCPIEYRCPSNSDSITPQKGRIEPIEDSDSVCKYGKFLLNRGETLNSDDKCVKCMCRFPPMVDCIKDPECYNSQSFDAPEAQDVPETPDK